MKTMWISVVGLVLALALGHPADAQRVSISIGTIEANQRISGSVSGLQPAEYPNYKVIVYVHTNKWYIHPFANQGEGLSWTAIEKDGTWRIKTERRQFRADRVAALLVRRNFPEPSEIEDGDFDRIQRSAVVVRQLRGTPDDGKL